MTTKEYLQQIDDVITNGKYKDSWESLSNTGLVLQRQARNFYSLGNLQRTCLRQ